MLSVKCDNCGSVNVLIDESVERTETHPRQMGTESYCVGKCEGVCESCKKDLSVEVDFLEYADTWIFHDRDETDCEMIDVKGFEEALRAFQNLSREVRTSVFPQA